LSTPDPNVLWHNGNGQLYKVSNSHYLSINMPNGHIPLPHHAQVIGPWETSSTRLAHSLADYLNSCQAINNCKLEKGPETKQVVSRIDGHLHFLSIQLENQIRQSRQILSRTRNLLAGTFYSVPHEVLAEIFTLVVYDRGNSHPKTIEDDSGEMSDCHMQSSGHLFRL
ncbi:unnamed protein product, partial [Rhizoctonia solani]